MSYAHPDYCRSLAEFGTPRELRRSGGNILVREIPGTDAVDGMGPYPLFACRDWSGLREDIDDLRGELTTLALVADPYADCDRRDLERVFDGVSLLKERFSVDLTKDPLASVTRHHAYYARRALRELEVTRLEDPSGFLERWVTLYANLVERHELRGIHAFSRRAFETQLALPGAELFVAHSGDECVGAHVWLRGDGVAYSHLTALSERGYRQFASYALYAEAIRCFSEEVDEGLRLLDLGAGAGVKSDGKDGLSKFKRGWSNSTRPTWFCSQVLDPGHYAELTREEPARSSTWFPAYRSSGKPDRASRFTTSPRGGR